MMVKLVGLLLAAVALSAYALLNPSHAPALGASLTGQVICLDPGHGGTESGAHYEKRGRGGWTIYEKDINLDIALNLQARLTADRATVVMTRMADETVSLQDRVNTCNAAGATILVSVHINSTYSSRWDGSNTLINKQADLDLAQAIHPVVYSGLRDGWSGRFSDYGIDTGDWFVPKFANMPAVILEPVFMSNNDEAEALHLRVAENPAGRRAKIVQVEYDGIVSYFANR